MSKNRQTLKLPQRERTSTELRTALEGIAALAEAPGASVVDAPITRELRPGDYLLVPRSQPTISLKRLRPDAILPAYQTAGAAAFDLHALDTVGLAPGASFKFGLGVATAFGPEWALFIYSRSGLGTKGLRLANGVGVVDSDYRGEISATLYNDSDVRQFVRAGDRIVQAVLQPVARGTIVEVDELPATERGDGGHGSTGK